MTDNLRDVFNRIAPGWYNYRHHTIFRPELEQLAAEWHGGRLLNAGCGHGADFLPFAGKFELYGIDFSAGMIDLARKYAQKYRFLPRLAVADITALPYIDDTFDYAIGIATYHHLRAVQRVPAMRELYRVLKPGGYAFITVWNRWQKKFWWKGRDVMVPWRTKETTLYRYYHPYARPEIKRLVRHAGFEVVKVFAERKSSRLWGFFAGNVCLILKKPETA